MTVDIEHLLYFFDKELNKFAGNDFAYYELYFESLLCSYPNQRDIWAAYLDATQYCDRQLSKNEIFKRACKNCRKVAAFKIQYLRSQELIDVPEKEYRDTIKNCLEDVNGETEDEYTIYKELLEYLTRHIEIDNREERIEKLRDEYLNAIRLFEGIDFSHNLAEEEYSMNFRIQWAEVETYKLKNKELAKELMEICVRSANAGTFYWLTYIKFMRHFDDTELIRSLCNRGVQYCPEYAEIAKAWVEWEKKFGDIKTILKCEAKIRGREKKERNKRVEERFEEYKALHNSSRKHVEPSEQEPVKKPPPTERHTLYVKGVPQGIKDEDLKGFFPGIDVVSVRIVCSASGVSKGYAYVDIKTPDMLKEALKFDGNELKGSKLSVKVSDPPAKRCDAKTIYVTKLSIEVEKSTLEEVFGKYGKIKEIRLHARGTPANQRRFAYIEYETENEAGRALEMNNTALKGRIIGVQPSISDKQKRQNLRSTVCVTNIDYSAKENEILNHFTSKFGKDSIRKWNFPLNRYSEFGGFGYIEFASDSYAEKAINMENKTIKGRRVSITMSTKPVPEKKEQSELPGKRKEPEKAFRREPKEPGATRRRKVLDIGGIGSMVKQDSKSEESDAGKEPSGGWTNKDFSEMGIKSKAPH